MKRINITSLVVTVIASLLTSCTVPLSPAPEPTAVILPTVTPTLTVVVPPTAVPTSTMIVPPAAEPLWLSILYPERAQIVLQSEYDQDIGFNTKSSICVEVAAQHLVEAGDYWEAEDVVERTVILVDGVQRYHSGGIRDYIVGFYFDGDRDVGGPYAFCMSAPVGAGIHRVDLSFKKSSGMTPVFSWSFEIVENSIPTATPLPAPGFTDERGNLPPYLRAVYPRPGQIVSLEKYVITVPEDKGIWDFSHLNEKAICFVFNIDKLKEVGSLPSDTEDWASRIYVKIDGSLLENWTHLYSYTGFSEDKELFQTHCVPGVSTPGHHSVTIYIYPYDKDLVMYSWGFMIIK
ncbi:MAG TPA: hypothetical protein VHP14_24515 [Anaerolineales bacterium]|nr:hypothetical protein [Anaerolineales bacterium]